MEHNDRPQKKAKKPETHKQKIIWYSIYALIALLFLGGVYMVIQQYVIIVPSIERPPTYAPATPTPEATIVQGEPTPTVTPYVKRAPVRIYFTKPGYWSDIHPVDIVETDGVLEMEALPSANDAAWYKDGAAPGEAGNVIINGHVSYQKKKGVFAYLRDMEYGEEVVVELDDGTFVYYEVYDILQHPIEEFPAFHYMQSGPDRMTLITCKGDYSNDAGTSLTRVVVVCTQKDSGTVPETPESTPAVADIP